MSGFTFPGMDARTKEIAMADELRAEVMRLLHEERDQDRALLEKLVTHLTLPPRSTWRVVNLGGDDTPHDVGIEFPAQVVYIDNGSTANVQVRAPGDIAQSPPIAASGQGRWLIPGATQVTVTGTGTGQVRLRFLNDAAARLLADNPPGGSTTSPVYASLTGGSIPAGSATIGAVNEQRYNGSAWEDVYNNTQGTLLASAARTAYGTSSTQTNTNARGVVFTINVTAVSGTSPEMSFTINFIDPVTGNPTYVGNSSNITATGAYNFIVYPANNVSSLGGQNLGIIGSPIPRDWQLAYNMGGTSPSFTFSVGYCYIL